MTSNKKRQRTVLLSVLGAFVLTSVWLMFRVLDWRVVEVSLSGGAVDVDGAAVVEMDSLTARYGKHFEDLVAALGEEKGWTEKIGELLGDSEKALRVDVGPQVPFAAVSRIYEAAGAAGFRYVCFGFEDKTICLENPFAVELELELEEEEELEDQGEELVLKDPAPGPSKEKREAQKAAARARARARAAALAGVSKYALEGWESDDSGLEFVVSAGFVILKTRTAVFSEGDSMSIAINIGDEENIAFQLTQKLAPAMASLKSRKGERPETIRVSAEPGVSAVRVLEITKTVETILDEKFGTQVSGEDGESHGLPVILAEAEVIHVSGEGLTSLNRLYEYPADSKKARIPGLFESLDTRMAEDRFLEERYGIEKRRTALAVVGPGAGLAGVFSAILHLGSRGFWNIDFVADPDLFVPISLAHLGVEAVIQAVEFDSVGITIVPAVVRGSPGKYVQSGPRAGQTNIPRRSIRVPYDDGQDRLSTFRQVFGDVQLQLRNSEFASKPYHVELVWRDDATVTDFLSVMREIRVMGTVFQTDDKGKVMILRPGFLFGGPGETENSLDEILEGQIGVTVP